MEIRNGRPRPTTRKSTGRTVDDADRVLTTKGVTVAYEHPTPRDTTTRWRCMDHEAPGIFDPADDVTLAAAREFCDGCDLKALCLDLGIRRGEWGVWGGVLLEGGKPVDQPRRVGRPK